MRISLHAAVSAPSWFATTPSGRLARDVAHQSAPVRTKSNGNSSGHSLAGYVAHHRQSTPRRKTMGRSSGHSPARYAWRHDRQSPARSISKSKNVKDVATPGTPAREATTEGTPSG